MVMSWLEDFASRHVPGNDWDVYNCRVSGYNLEVKRLECVVVKDSQHELFQMLKYTVQCANVYFRLLHQEGLWLDSATSTLASKACHEMTAS